MLSDVERYREQVRKVVAGLVKRKVSDDQLLLSSGLIDSLSVLRLISSLESELHIRIAKDQVQPDDFDSVDRVLETIERTAVLQ